MFVRKFKKLFQLLKHRKAVKALISSHLSLLEGDGVAASLGGLTDEEERAISALVRECVSSLVPEAKDGPIMRECVSSLAKEERAGPIVEFGTLFGLTTQLLAEAAPDGVTVLTVDNFCWNPFGLPPDLHRQFTRRILRPYLASGRVRLIDKDSALFRERNAGPIPQLVFFDADHSYEAVRDEIAWAKRMKVPVISGHDYGNALFEVTRAVDEAFPEGVSVKGMVWWKVGRPLAQA